ncbi:MAG: peptidoglycan DD-metalloendopeptidase family protein [Candidatus Rokubacteria bacterium]|nr:peptidoglycan DD-metalloendopeptidase family protein [Candidatus Rokubacteria bacterium]
MRHLGLVLCLSLVTSLPVVPASAQRKVDATIRDKERTLQQTQRQLREEEAKAQEARKREASVLAELEAVDRKLSEKRRELARLDGLTRKAEAEIAALEAEIRRLEQRRVSQQHLLARRLRVLYKLHSRGGVLPMILGGDDPVVQAVQLRHLTTLARVDARLIQEYRVTEDSLADRKAEGEVRKRDLSALRAQVAQERAEVDREAARRRTLLAKVRDQRAYHERMVGELSEAARRLEALIKELQAKSRRVVKAPAPTGIEAPAVGFGTLRGRLPWPAEGRVVSAFGEQVHPRFGTRTFRSGIDIEASEGTEIVAVYAGQVVYTGWFKGYGNLMILDHGSDYYTLYAHAAEIRVKEGEDVRQGQVIGTVGDTGSLAGSRLYFEVRYQGRPQDPAGWLQHRG